MVNMIDLRFLGSLQEKSYFDLLVINGGTGDASLLSKLARSARHVFCADGGAIALHRWAPEIIPEFITGDMDSLTGSEAETYYRDINIPIIKVWDQNKTDLQKALTLWKERFGRDSNVVVWCNFDGSRVDHEFSNYNTLFKRANDFLSLVLVSQSSVIAVIPSGETILNVADCMLTTEKSRNYCGLIPLFRPVQNIETKGFKWDCGEGYSNMKFGSGLLSTSNEILSKEVIIKTSDPFLLTMTIDCDSTVALSKL